MRWQSLSAKKSNYGDVRVRSKFLIFPKYINGEWRWFERASYKQEYDMIIACDGMHFGWKDTEWVD